MRAVYRVGQGTFVGDVDPDGVLRGWWCDAPTRQPPDDAGEVEWTLVRSDDGEETAFGSWRYGTQEPLKGGWDLEKIGGPEPPDIAARFDDAAQFCPHPRDDRSPPRLERLAYLKSSFRLIRRAGLATTEA